MLKGIEFARRRDWPFLGTCGGFQYAVIECARNVLGIKDADTANKAMADLNAASDTIGKVAAMADKIPADGKTAMAAAIKAGMTAMAPMVTAAESNAAAGPIVKPVLDGMMAKLDAMTK